MQINRREWFAGMLLSRAASADSQDGKTAGVERIAPMARPGYESKPASRADSLLWVQVDLGAVHTIEAVKLYPVYDWISGDIFPVRFRIEASSDPQFGTAATIADFTGADYASPADQIRTFNKAGIQGRYVRLTVTRLRLAKNAFEAKKAFKYGLAKLDVISGDRNIAQGCPVSDSAAGALGVTALTRAPRPMGDGVFTDNPGNVISERTWKRPATHVEIPNGGVRLEGGPLHTALENNVGYLLESWNFDELVREFRDRAGKPNPPGLRKQDSFWEHDLAGSNAGRFLMGAGNAVRWTDHAELRDRLNRVVDVIDECRQPNGYIMAYPEDSIFYSERGGYTRAWVTHGLIEAGYAGNPKAFKLLRGYYDWFDRCPYLPELLRRSAQGVQGMIANTRMYLTPAGKPADIQVIQRYFQENYWLDQLAKRELRAIWQYPYDRPHCYLITDLEAYMDLYLATGDKRYLDACSGGWDLYHDNWEHVGGTIAICEFLTYPPKSYLLHAETGEFCGNVFWSEFNQRFHRLYPDEEKYINEIEKSIYNVALANQVGTKGIIYHAKLLGRKGDGDTVYSMVRNTCCAGQGTRMLGSLPEYIYSIAPDGLYVNLFEASSIRWKQGGQALSAKMTTRFPFQPKVELKLSMEQQTRSRIRVRVPAWASGPMPIRINGTLAATGKPGSYAVLERTWSDGDMISFTLPMAFRLTRYAGTDKLVSAAHYALEYGPILMALTGDVDDKGVARVPHRPEDLLGSLKPGEKPLHFRIAGDDRHEYMPYWLVETQAFTCYPAIGAA
ncbi:MAG: glycoside hydrolase family 127 protein [Acidobacteria bacterium]|nr:glycoside hydrolase family 127 protein [Acidobacteriota bacterium]